MKSVRQGYKMTELGEIPEEWKIVNLEEVINEFIVPMRDKPKVFDGDIPWCRIEDIEGNYLNGNKESRFVSEKTIKEMNLKVFPQGTLIASCSATLGVYAINTTPLITNQTFIGLVPSEKINVNYLLYYMNTTTDRLKNIASGTTIPYISRQKFEKFKIVLPNIEEQEKIASILSTVDEQIDNIDALIEKNKELKKGLMQTLLTKGIGHTKFKKTEIGEIPEEWEVRILGDIVEFSQGIQVSLEEQYEEYKYGYERFLRIIDYTQKSKEYRYIKHPGERYLVKNNDVVMVRYGATAGFVGTGLEGAIANNIFKITPNREVLLKEFLYVYLNQDNIFKSLNMATGASAMPAINFGIVSKLNIILPSIYEQKKITSILFEVDKKLEEYENKKQKLEELKKGLMQQLLTGKIRVI